MIELTKEGEKFFRERRKSAREPKSRMQMLADGLDEFYIDTVSFEEPPKYNLRVKAGMKEEAEELAQKIFIFPNQIVVSETFDEFMKDK